MTRLKNLWGRIKAHTALSLELRELQLRIRAVAGITSTIGTSSEDIRQAGARLLMHALCLGLSVDEAIQAMSAGEPFVMKERKGRVK